MGSPRVAPTPIPSGTCLRPGRACRARPRTCAHVRARGTTRHSAALCGTVWHFRQVAVREACVLPYTAFYTHLITIKTREHIFDLL